MRDFFGIAMVAINRRMAKFPRLSASALVTLLVINHGMLAEHGAASIDAMIEAWPEVAVFAPSDAAVIAGSALTFLFFSWQLWGLREKLLRVSASVSPIEKHKAAHAVQILFLSDRKRDDKHGRTPAIPGPPTFSEWTRQYDAAKKILARAIPGASATVLLHALEDVCSTEGDCGGWNWQQPLRAIRSDLVQSVASPDHPLHEIVVLGSAKSRLDFPLFETLMAPFLRAWPLGRVELVMKGDVIDQDKVDETSTFLKELIAEKEAQYRKRKICIDATAGSKMFSIAAAVATLNKDVRFLYTGNDAKTTSYDLNVSGIEFGMD